jgi:hypothetical protein
MTGRQSQLPGRALKSGKYLLGLMAQTGDREVVMAASSAKPYSSDPPPAGVQFLPLPAGLTSPRPGEVDLSQACIAPCQKG